MVINKRNTVQKSKILQYLQSVKSHPNAEVVFENVKKDLPMISLATVYRNLNLIADEGEILRIEVNGEFRYDANVCGHVHLVCIKCGLILDKEFEKKCDLKFKDFNVHCYSLIAKGICSRCSRREKC